MLYYNVSECGTMRQQSVSQAALSDDEKGLIMIESDPERDYAFVLVQH